MFVNNKSSELIIVSGVNATIVKEGRGGLSDEGFATDSVRNLIQGFATETSFSETWSSSAGSQKHGPLLSQGLKEG